jgi:hypothetical protein
MAEVDDGAVTHHLRRSGSYSVPLSVVGNRIALRPQAGTSLLIATGLADVVPFVRFGPRAQTYAESAAEGVMLSVVRRVRSRAIRHDLEALLV